jgi:hypothetical protein
MLRTINFKESYNLLKTILLIRILLHLLKLSLNLMVLIINDALY